MKAKNIYFLIILINLFLSCDKHSNTENDKLEIAKMLDSFNIAAAKADYETYFNYFAPDATFLGTDATEYWTKKEFMIWSKPYFDKKITWNFKSIQRNIYVDKNADIAWFDELLNTQMKICRGSGIVVKNNNEWKIQQYVLSTTVPNANIDEIVKIKTVIEDNLIAKMTKK